MYYPASLSDGDSIRIVAPSGPFDAALLKSGLDRLARFHCSIPSDLLSRRDGFFAGNDEQRRIELQKALDCPYSRAIWIARGGYGISRLLSQLSFEGFKKNPKWVIGFSDTTALHLRIFQEGYASLHAPNITGLSTTSRIDVLALRRTLMGEYSSRNTGLEGLSGVQARGPLVGGNLSVLHAEAAAGRLRLPNGGVLLLEDVCETSYRIDRMLYTLIAGEHLSPLSGIILGEFTDCSAGKFSVPVEKVLVENLSHLGLAVARGLPVGHGSKNAPLVLGTMASLDANAGTLTLERE